MTFDFGMIPFQVGKRRGTPSIAVRPLDGRSTATASSLKAVAAQVRLFPPARLAEAFERRFGVTPRLFRDMHPAL